MYWTEELTGVGLAVGLEVGVSVDVGGFDLVKGECIAS